MTKANKEEEKKSLGKQQSLDISTIYKDVFNDIQREAFLLGRISAFLDFGNGMSDSANDAIKETEKILVEVKTRLRKSPVKIEATKKRTTKPRKEVKKKDE